LLFILYALIHEACSLVVKGGGEKGKKNFFLPFHVRFVSTLFSRIAKGEGEMEAKPSGGNINDEIKK
jgi:hypothetical protein